MRFVWRIEESIEIELCLALGLQTNTMEAVVVKEPGIHCLFVRGPPRFKASVRTTMPLQNGLSKAERMAKDQEIYSSCFTHVLSAP
jgi:hypothetical protein